MDSTRSVRQGQIEIGIIEHNGHEYVALGATVVRQRPDGLRQVQAKSFLVDDWAGGTMLDCRSEVVERYWNGGMALMFRLPVVGSSWDMSSTATEALFRGELIDNCDEDEARHHCLMVANNWMELDAEDQEAELAEV